MEARLLTGELNQRPTQLRTQQLPTTRTFYKAAPSCLLPLILQQFSRFLLVFLYKVGRETVVRLACSKITPYAYIGIYKYLVALQPRSKLTSESREGLAPAPGRDQGVCEPSALVSCQAANSAYISVNNYSELGKASPACAGGKGRWAGGQVLVTFSVLSPASVQKRERLLKIASRSAGAFTSA